MSRIFIRRITFLLFCFGLLMLPFAPGQSQEKAAQATETVLFNTILADLINGQVFKPENPDLKARIELLQNRVTTFQSRLPRLDTPLGPLSYVHEKRVQIERGIVALIPTQGIEDKAAEFAEKIPIAYEWEGMSDGPLGEATFGEQFLNAHPDTPVKAYLNLFIAHRLHCAYETLCREKKRDQAKEAFRKYEKYLGAALTDPDPLVRLIAKDMDRRPFLYLDGDCDLMRGSTDQIATPSDCPETASDELIADPWAWALDCFALSVGKEAGVKGSLTEFSADLDTDGVMELFLGSRVANGNAGGLYYVFKPEDSSYVYLGSLFLHPAAFKILGPDKDGRPRMARYVRQGAGEGLLETLIYGGKAFRKIRSEKVFPLGKDGPRLAGLFGGTFQDISGQPDPKDEVKANRISVTCKGEIRKGESFEFTFGPDLVFHLEPLLLGWMITVRNNKERGDDLSRLTPPLHFSPNPRYIEGWHFRNSDNSGPNEPGAKNVNAPGEVRDFIFSPDVGRDVTGSSPTPEEIEKIRAYGQGSLTILEYRLGNLEPSKQASMEWMRFEVHLSRRR